MSDPSQGEEFDRLAESFLARLRRGEHPNLPEYAARYPALENEILELFPALVEMEGLKEISGSLTDSYGKGQNHPKGSHAPERLGDYRILRIIGSGGMGIVYEAERESLRAHVALKVLHPRCQGDTTFQKRFRNEAQSAARLHHTNIVSVFDFGDHEGILYYVMQYIPGQGLDRLLEEVRKLRKDSCSEPGGEENGLERTLAQALHTGRYPSGPSPSQQDSPSEKLGTTVEGKVADVPDRDNPHGSVGIDREVGIVSQVSAITGADQSCYHREVVRIGAEIADALAYAHGRGVLHRDIKPSNVLLDARGTAWITDFGLAKFQEGEDLTETGDVLGTLRYMAPERFEGHSSDRGDIYALGVTLYEMLALRPAFHEANRAMLIRNIFHEIPKPLREYDPRISRDLETVVHKAMARDPSDRYATASELADELRLVMENRPIRARRITFREQYWRWCRRNPVVAGLSIAAAVMMLTIFTVSTVAAILLKGSNAVVKSQLEEVKKARNEASKQLQVATNAVRERDERLREAKLATARASRFSGRSGRRFDSLDAIAEAVKLSRQLGHRPERFDELRSEAIAAIALPDIQIRKTFGPWTDGIVSVDVSDDFALYAISDSRGECIVRRTEDESEVTRLPRSDRPRRIAFGPGRLLTDHDDTGARTLKVWDLGGTVPVVRIEERRSVVTWNFRPDGRLVAMMLADGSLATYRLPDGAKAHFLPPRQIKNEPRLKLHPTDPVVVITSYSSDVVELRHLATGEVIEVPTYGEPLQNWAGGNTPDWNRDGKVLAVPVTDAFRVSLFDYTERPLSLRFVRAINAEDGIYTAAFNKDGDRLYLRGWSNRILMNDVATGRSLFATLPNPFPFESGRVRLIHRDESGLRLFPGTVEETSRRFGYWTVAEGRESRLHPWLPNEPHGRWVDFDRSGRVSMTTSGGQIVFRDAELGRELARLSLTDRGNGIHFSVAPSGDLLTSSLDGSFRWPIRPDPGAPDTLLIGPPQPLDFPTVGNVMSASEDGMVVAQAQMLDDGSTIEKGGWLLNQKIDDTPRYLSPGRAIGSVSVSPDGKWVSLSGAPGRIDVYNTATMERVWGSNDLSGGCSFTPDGKWMATAIEDGRLYEAGTWKPGPRLGPGYICTFSADGKLVLMTNPDGRLKLVEILTGRVIIVLEAPESQQHYAALSPDGATILVMVNEGVRVWDLRLVREELKNIGLDWDAPAYPPRIPLNPKLKVEVIGMHRLSPRYQAAEKTARDLLRPFLKSKLAVGSDFLARGQAYSRLGFYNLAMRDYDRAIAMGDCPADCWKSRAYERLRREDWKGAIEDLDRALDSSLPTFSLLFRRAWAFRELGQIDREETDLSRLLDQVALTNDQRITTLIARAEVRAATGREVLAKADRDAARSHSATVDVSVNNVAWELLIGPPEERVTRAGMFLARLAFEPHPSDRLIGNTMQLALYRTGAYREAIELNAKLVADGPWDQDGWDSLVMALCRAGSGQRDQALVEYERAVAWRVKFPIADRQQSRQFDWLQNEAKKALQLPR